MFLIVFKTGHACPLVFTRFLCPRICRGASAERLGDMNRSWPQTWPIHRPRRNSYSAQARTAHIHEQFVSASSPRKQARRQTVRVHNHTAALNHREPAWIADATCPKPGPNPRSSGFLTALHTHVGRERRLTEEHIVRSIAVFMFPQTCFSSPIRNISGYVVI